MKLISPVKTRALVGRRTRSGNVIGPARLPCGCDDGGLINPLLNVLMGYAFLGERLRRLQKLSVLLALIGVTILTVHIGEVPTIPLVLPATFGLYGLVRKVAHI